MENNWISVKDRLPDDTENVLAYAPLNNENCSIEVAFYSSVIWMGAPIYFLDKITHWMPLPEPPKS